MRWPSAQTALSTSAIRRSATTTLPIPPPIYMTSHAFIAHYWDDLVVQGNVYVQDMGDKLVIEYYNVRRYAGARRAPGKRFSSATAVS